jgi:hypothetical protein
MNRLTELLYQNRGVRTVNTFLFLIRSHALIIAPTLVGLSALSTTLVLAVVGELLQGMSVTLFCACRVASLTSSPPMCQSLELH